MALGVCVAVLLGFALLFCVHYSFYIASALFWLGVLRVLVYRI